MRGQSIQRSFHPRGIILATGLAAESAQKTGPEIIRREETV